MRKIYSGLFMSLDGVVEAPGTWSMSYFTPEVGQAVGSGMAESDAILLGRRTYQEFVAYWPNKTAADDPFADYINNTMKYVVSTTLKTIEWRNSRLITGDNILEQIATLKQQPGKSIGITGSPRLVRSLLQSGLLDQLRLLLYPLVLGRGKRLFDDRIGQVPLRLVDSKTFRNGVLSLTYERAPH